MHKRAFIIDDDQICHFITRHLIKMEGLAQEVTCFFDAQEVCQLLRTDFYQHIPDMIFLDLNMPHMNGWQFLDALRPYARQIANKSLIFILTSSLDPTDKEKAQEYPFVSGYFNKPLQASDLAKIASILNDSISTQS